MPVKLLNRDAEILKFARREGVQENTLDQPIVITRRAQFAHTVDNYYAGYSDGQEATIRAIPQKPRIIQRRIVLGAAAALVILNLPLLVLYALHLFRTW